MKVTIENYHHRPGEHCGSTALRNLLLHYLGLDISEALTFGLGSGLEFTYLRSPEYDPEAMIFGRSATLEMDLADALGIDYREAPEFDDAMAWEKVRGETADGRPTVICCDIFYMDHREYKVHFPFNRFVIIGFDDDARKVFIHDRVNREPQAVSYDALALSRNPPEYPIYNTWGRFRSGDMKRSLEEACLRALRKSALRMTGRDDAQKKLINVMLEGRAGAIDTGLEALKVFQNELPTWSEKKKAASLFSYSSQTIEKFGTGGGNFRRMYAAFLAEARVMLPDIVDEELPVLATESGDLWTSLSKSMNDLAKGKGKDALGVSLNLIGNIIDHETRIFNNLLGKLSA